LDYGDFEMKSQYLYKGEFQRRGGGGSISPFTSLTRTLINYVVTMSSKYFSRNTIPVHCSFKVSLFLHKILIALRFEFSLSCSSSMEFDSTRIACC